mgnify:CR=1 FL=1
MKDQSYDAFEFTVKTEISEEMVPITIQESKPLPPAPRQQTTILKIVQDDVEVETEIEIDLAAQKITLKSTGESESFDINEYKKENMKHGFDDIDYLLNMSAEIDAFEEGK